MLVTHDRSLLADTVDEILELDRRTGRGRLFRGGWDDFERERRVERERAYAEHEQALARRAQLSAAERETRQRAAASVRRARARVHDNDKQSKEWVTMRAEGMTRRARKMGGRAERIVVPERPFEPPRSRAVTRPSGTFARSPDSTSDRRGPRWRRLACARHDQRLRQELRVDRVLSLGHSGA